MADQIISREHIRKKARAAFARNAGRNAHHMNPGAAALADWLAEYDRLAALPALHFAPAVRARVDAAQVAA